MVWTPVWLNVLQTIVWLPFKSHAQSSFDKNVLLSNPYSKMVGFCFGLAIPTLDWYTTLVEKLSSTSRVISVGPTILKKEFILQHKLREDMSIVCLGPLL